MPDVVVIHFNLITTTPIFVKGGTEQDYAEQMFILVPMPYKLDEIFDDYKLQIEFRENLLNMAFNRMEKSLNLEIRVFL